MGKLEAILFDMALRESLHPVTKPGQPPPHRPLIAPQLRPLLLSARRFVLDRTMSGYIADLTWAAFQANPSRMITIAEGARRLARLPHKVTWIEYDNAAFKCRMLSEYKDFVWKTDEDEHKFWSEVDSRRGWLLEQLAATHFRLTMIYQRSSWFKGIPIMLPLRFEWLADDETQGLVADDSRDPKIVPLLLNVCGDPSPWEFAAGISDYSNDRVRLLGPADGTVLVGAHKETRKGLVTLVVKEVFKNQLDYSRGELRKVWTLLATINDLPTFIEQVRPTKGYVARGRYHHFVEHKIIHLRVPETKSLRTLAARAVALIRRRAHQVRGHWRKDWRQPASAFCQHQWHADSGGMICQLCHGHRIWIVEHQRGDAGLGFVTHDYVVERGD